uniref:Nonribosomal peptide synthetase subunit 2 n=3 Tax=Bacteria TaxID=2 RepID=A0A4D6P1M8_9BACT|nr:nonribosomal peptide synthetase subunit 2 [Cystobacter sp. SBCb004]QCE43607.1 nonribosomal peptide synthetase subunit 2 [Expression vector pArg23-V1]QCE43611.1 nonribosomal peptide synthetase subunit 2 [Expression vector pArg235-V1]QCE43616.1 nonribosomal peptide synthetase subunit 2 [Expression vector pArg2345-V2]QCE43622.1 nonribosomal peptide synthetase subunit 2 [Expression vector pArg2345-V1]QCE43628.1 nonribosomal peptide synthetase subunit 2 [Expression vector pArg2345-V1-BsaI]UEN69
MHLPELLPLSFAQTRLWFLEQLFPGRATYHIPQFWRLRGGVNVSALVKALKNTAARHESLRTTFVTENGEPRQAIHEDMALDFECETLDERGGETLDSYLSALTARTFSVSEGPLWRVRLVRTSAREQVLAVVFHHIICDGWSMGIFSREVSHHYNQAIGESLGELSEPPIQFGDFAQWQREWLQGERLELQLSYWAEKLKGAPDLLALPTDFSRPPAASNKGKLYGTFVPPEVVQRLKDLARQEKATLFMVLMAAFKVLLRRYSGSDDIVVGTPIANRHYPDVEEVFGYFANTLALRTPLEGSASFRQVLQRVKHSTLEAYEHQDLPLELVVDKLGVERDLSRHPVFQVMFALLTEGRSTLGVGKTELRLEGLEVESLRGVGDCAKFDLALLAEETEQGLFLEFEYSTDLFEQATIERVARHFQNLLVEVVAGPGSSIDDYFVLSDAEIAERIACLDGYGLPHDTEICLHQWVERFAARTPQAIALRDQTGSMTYRELNEEANRLARCLLERGLGHGQIVGLALPRTRELIVAMVAALKARAAYLPLDLGYPSQRLRFILEDAETAAVLTTRAHVESLRGHCKHIIALEDVAAEVAGQSAGNLDLDYASGDLAYLIYTSGSTGKPKGATICHRNVTRLFPDPEPLYRFRPDDCWTFFHSCAFDLSVWEIWGALSHGSTLSVVPAEVARSTDEFREWLVAHRVTVLNQTPSAYEQLLSYISREGGSDGLRLHTVMLGGEGWGEALAERHRQLLPHVSLYNEYGPAECAVWTTHGCVYDAETVQSYPLDLGIAHSQSLALILNDGHRVTPTGVVGELYLGGEGVTQGYWKRPELNKEKFVHVSLPGKGNVRLYKTGDLGRYKSNGRIEFIGRRDHQVKVRGYRIELGEIESILRSLPGVRDALVMLSESGRQLVAYVVVGEGGTLTQETIAYQLKDALPAYMVPSFFVLLERFPMTNNGKVDRAALPKPHATTGQSVGAQAFVAPSGPLEEGIASVFSELLAITPFSAEGNFFSLGGHSLLATQAAAKIHQRLGIACPVRTLFESSTPRALAWKLGQEGTKQAVAGAALPVLQPNEQDRHQPFPLTDIQEAYWIGRKGALTLGEVSVHCYIEYDMDELDVGRLERALNRLVQRHEAMRLVVEESGQQRVLESVPFYKIEVTELSRGSREEEARALASVRERMAHQVLPADRWPLFEIRASRAHGFWRLHVSLDALVLDAWSLNLIFNEWARLYRDEETRLEPLNVSFRDYVIAEKAFKSTQTWQKAKDYWLARVATLPDAPQLPLAQSQTRLDAQHFNREQKRLTPEALRSLRKLADKHKVSLSSVLGAVFADVLSLWSSKPHFTLNMTLFNRLPVHEQINDIAGDFTSLNLLEVDWRGSDVPFIERVRKVQEQLWSDLDHRFFSGVQVLRELARARNNPAVAMPVVFTCLLGSTEGEGQAHEWERLFPNEVFNITQTPQVWLDYQVYESQGELVVCWDYVEGLFPEGLVGAMHEAYITSLERLLREESAWNETRLTNLPESQRIRREEANATAWREPELLMHQLFERQVGVAPDATAVIDSEGSYTYRQLNVAANRIARRLASLGLEPNERVAVLAPKGWRQVVACLGIQKAGAAYLPVDGSAPAERINKVLELGRVRAAVVASLEYGGAFGSNALIVLDDGLLAPASGTEDVSNPAPKQTLADLAYVIFTSGSTGTPKGVMIDHRGAVNTLLDINERFGVRQDDRVLALSSLTFDLSVYDIFGLLAAGGAVVIPPEAHVKEPAEWCHWLVQHQVTVWNTVPMFMQMLMEFVGALPVAEREALSRTLRLVMMSGDWIPVELPNTIKRVFQREDLRVMSLGGATEASIWSIAYEIKDVAKDWTSIPYGKPLRNQTFHVLDEGMRPRPDFVPGQLYIGGMGVALGYFGDEAKTAASFLRHPHTGERLYRTGDLGRYLADGNIEFLGREDLQVKVGGHRIELGEIDHHLHKCGWIRQGLTHVFKPDGRNPQLVAYLVPEGVTGKSEQERAEELSFKLAGHNLRKTGGAGHRLVTELEPKVYFQRKSYRVFAGEESRLSQLEAWLRSALLPGKPLATERREWTVAEMLAPLLALREDGLLLPKYRYGSAGSLYPVQTYLVMGEGRKELAPGVYYLDPVKHELVRLADGALACSWLSRRGVPLALCFVEKRSAIEPLYGTRSDLYSAIEAGSMAALVASSTAAAGISWRTRSAPDLEELAPVVLESADCSAIAVLEPRELQALDERGKDSDVSVLMYVMRGSEHGPRTGWYRWSGDHFEAFSAPALSMVPSNPANWSICQNASFALFVMEGKAQPRTSSALFTGRLIQSLMEKGVGLGLGGCSIGEMDPEGGRLLREVHDGEFVHAFFGGPVDSAQISAVGTSEAEPFEQLVKRKTRSVLEGSLPGYMVPDHYVLLDSFPLSSNGKVDRSRLAAPELERPQKQDALVRPWNSTEAVIASIWAQLLGVEPDAADNFFALGGHSLTATQLCTRLREAFGVEVPLREVFGRADVRSQASMVEGLLKQHVGRGASIPRRAGTGRSVASYAQKRLWFVEQLAENGSVYGMPVAVALQGPMDWDAFKKALAGVVARHEILRTTFHMEQGELWQVIHEEITAPFETEQCPEGSVMEKRAYVRKRMRELARVPFDLSTGPLLRFHAFALSREQHILFGAMHHIISDGWSVDVFQSELSALYNAALSGSTPQFQELSIQYADFAAWQRDWLRGPRSEKQLQFWKDSLAGAPELLQLPTDLPRPERQSFRGGVVRRTLDAQLTAEIDSRCREWGVTPFMFYLAAYKVLLSKLSGQADILVGTPAANRHYSQVERLIGYFANTLAIRSRVEGQRSFAEYVQAVREGVLAANENQDVPFEQVVESLQLRRSLAYQPVFQVMFVFENEGRSSLSLNGVSVQPVSLDAQVARFDLTLLIRNAGDAREISFEYSEDLFKRETAAEWLDGVISLVEAATRDSSQPLAALPSMSEATLEKVLGQFSRGERTASPKLCLHEQFERVVARQGELCAIQTPRSEITYEQLNDRANRVARLLSSHGIRKGDVVALCLKRSPDLFACYLAVLKLGAVYVAIDGEYPERRIQHMLTDAGAKLVVASPVYADKLGTAPVLVTLEECEDRLESMAGSNLSVKVSPEDVAYIIYTSGTTGLPKGARVKHRGVSNLVLAQQEYFVAGPGKRLLQFASCSFDGAIWEWTTALLNGATLCLVAESSAEVVSRLTRRDEQPRIDIAALPPSVVASLPDDCLPGLEVLLVAGESCPRGVVDRWSRRTRMFNAYGPCEASVTSTMFEFDGTRGASTIGRPLRNCDVYILDERMLPVPPGVAGELCIAGLGLAEGYHNRAEETERRFVEASIGSETVRMYRTGDRGRWASDGNIEFLGRLDNQIKIRGIRVEPDEVRTQLLQVPGVAQAAVVVDREGQETRLLAYVVASPEVPLDLEHVRKRLRAALPEALVPSWFCPVATLPMTLNGKLDVEALPRPGEERTEARFEEGATEVERKLQALIAGVLEGRRLGRHDDFFRNGGHSLKAIHLVAEIRKELGAELAVKTIFDAPTVAELARVIESERRQEGPTASRPRLEGSRFTLSALQRQMWLAEKVLQRSGAYNMPLCLELRGAPDASALQNAVDMLLQRHGVLRWQFKEESGEPYAEDCGVDTVTLATLDWRELGQQEKDTALAGLIATPFNLSQGPLWRGALIRIGEERFWLLLCAHHLLADGWSLGLLLGELAELYNARVGHGTARLPAPGTEYSRYVEQSVGDERELERQLEFWRHQLEGAPQRLALPMELKRSLSPGKAGAVDFEVGPELTARLRELAEQRGSSLVMVLMSTYQAVLARFAGADDVLIGTPVACRHKPELLNTIGLLVNTLPIRLSLTPRTTFAEALAQVRQRLLEGMAHMDVPFERIVSAVAQEREPGVPALCQAMFVWEEGARGDLKLRGLDVSLKATPVTSAKYDLALLASEQDGRVTGRLEYPEGLYDRASVEQLALSYVKLLSEMAKDLEGIVAQAELMSQEQRRQLEAWFEYRPEFLEAPNLHTLIERQAATAPASSALRYKGESYSYEWLNTQANRLARYLGARGIGRGSVVALCLARSPELVVAWVAVLKSGAAFVSLDPHMPQARRRFILDDSRTALVLSHAAFAEELGTGTDIAVWEEVAKQLTGLPAENLELEVRQEELAYLIYTSGTTGNPKGTMLAHRGMINLAVSEKQRSGMGPQSKVLQFTTATCDGSIWEWTSALVNGAELWLLDASNPQEQVAQAMQLLSEPGITTVALTPSVVELLPPEAMPTVQSLTLAGEACPLALLEKWSARIPGVANVYGPTEATVTTATFPFRPGYPANTIGKPLANVQVYILDEHGKLLPPGVIGELCIAGVGLALGYLDRDELTQRKFVTHPIGPRGEPVRVYRSGDLARYLPDGHIVFEGRRDNQVKVRGYRVELDEVAWVLKQHPQVQQASVIVSQAGKRYPYLVAYVVPRTPPSSPASLRAELRAYMAERLSHYMVPEAYVFIESLPLNRSSMKVEVSLLPPPEGDSFVRDTLVPPETAVEKELATLWMELLGVGSTGRHDSFFRLGGNSLLAVKLGHAIGERWGCDISLPRIFENDTLAALARCIEADERRSHDLQLARASERESWPLSFAQGRMWFLEHLTQGSSAYHVPLVLRLIGKVSFERLAQALSALVVRHEVLRTAYVEDGNTLSQKILDAVAVEMASSDLSPIAPSERQAAVDRLLGADLARPFALAAGENVRARLVRFSEDEHLLCLCLHHIALDGWSISVLLRELGSLYRGQPLQPLPLRYVDFACWQRDVLEKRFAEQLDYWKAELRELPRQLELPWDHPRPPRQDYRGASARRPLSGELRAALKQVAERYDVTDFMLYLTSFQLWLGRLSNSCDVVVGTPVANRHYNGVESIVGLFVNTLPLRLRYDGSETFGGVVRRMKSKVLEAYSHQDVPFEYLVDHLEVPRELSHAPIFQAMFLLQDESGREIDLGDVQGRIAPVAGTVARFDVSLLVEFDEEGAELNLEYASALFRPETIDEWLESFELFLRAIAADAEAPVRRFELLPPRMRSFLSEVGTGPRREYGSLPLPELVAEQAKHGGQRIAVEGVRESWTYGELLAAAERVAAGLQRRGVRPGDGVAIALPRDHRLPSAMLGVLKAGAFYVPLDLTHPERRLQYIAGDAKARFVITGGETRFGFDIPRVNLDELLEETSEARPVPIAPSSLAYVIYTSGSTGEPKGVMVSHASLSNFLHAMVEELGFGPDERLLAITTIAFDISGLELFLPLIRGARVVIADEDSTRDPRLLSRWIDERRISVMQATPATWRMLMDASWVAPGSFKALVGGEALPRNLADFMTSRVSQVWNVYGPTEATIWSTIARLKSGERVHIGRPLANTEAFVLDDGLRAVPRGTLGELHLGGSGLATGYLGREELTRQKFVHHPELGRRLYKTGDLARVLPSGDIEFVARRDAQLKIRGFRIEPGEVEAVLSRVPGVARVTVLPVGEGEGTQLAAFLLTGDERLQAQARALAEQQLPEYMRPARYVVVPEFPLTPNGKVDTKALRALVSEQVEEAAGSAPKNPIEFRISRLWSALLGVRHPGTRDNFFALGGTSLAAVRLARELESEFGIEVRVGDIFRKPTIAELAGLVETQGSERVLEPLVLLSREQQKPPLFVIHPAGGMAYCYAGLAQELSGFTVHGLNQPHYYELEHRFETLAEMAADYVARIKRLQPTGPYRLLGWSFGGTLAYEMARQLEQAGEAISGVVMLDAHHVSPLGANLPTVDVSAMLANLGLGGEMADPYLEKDIRESERLSRDYKASPVRFPVLLFKPTERNGFEERLYADLYNGWRECAENSVVRSVTGDHGGVLDRRNVSELARVVEAFLSGGYGVLLREAVQPALAFALAERDRFVARRLVEQLPRDLVERWLKSAIDCLPESVRPEGSFVQALLE